MSGKIPPCQRRVSTAGTTCNDFFFWLVNLIQTFRNKDLTRPLLREIQRFNKPLIRPATSRRGVTFGGRVG